MTLCLCPPRAMMQTSAVHEVQVRLFPAFNLQASLQPVANTEVSFILCLTVPVWWLGLPPPLWDVGRWCSADQVYNFVKESTNVLRTCDDGADAQPGGSCCRTQRNKQLKKKAIPAIFWFFQGFRPYLIDLRFSLTQQFRTRSNVRVDCYFSRLFIC